MVNLQIDIFNPALYDMKVKIKNPELQFEKLCVVKLSVLVRPEICKMYPFAVTLVTVVLRYELVQKEGRFE